MKLLPVLLYSLLLTVSCKKDKPDVQKPITEDRLKKCFISNGSSLLFLYKSYGNFKYIYDDDSFLIKLLTFDSDTSVTERFCTLNYDVQKKYVTKLTLDFRPYSGYYDFFYNKDNILNAVEFYGNYEHGDPYMFLLNRTEFKYNLTGQIIETIISYSFQNRYLAKTSFYYNENGNVEKVLDSVKNSEVYEFSEIKEYKYDNKRNPNYKMPLLNILSFAGIYSPDNIIYMKQQCKENQQIIVRENTYTYTYTNEGFPETVTDLNSQSVKTNSFGYFCK